MTDVPARMVADRTDGFEFCFCVVVASRGSVPRQAGAKMLVYRDKRIFGTIGGGRVERRVIDDALDLLEKGLPRLLHYDLLKDLGMSCGVKLPLS